MHLPIYLDYMATTPVDPRVAEKMQRCLTLDGIFGNAGSKSHSYGQRAREIVEAARQQVADLIQADAKEIIWTSGATEANNLAIKGATSFYQRKGKHIITYETEHKAVLDVFKFLETKGFNVTYLKPKPNGIIDSDELIAAIRDDTILLSVMHVNNETGVIQDIAAIGQLTRPRGILLHVDAAQSAGKILIDLKNWQIDLMSFSAHKVYGPKGIGALFVRRNPRLHLEPLIHGGNQEYGLRSGTLATHQIVGMGEAFQIAKQELVTESQRILTLRNYLWEGIKKIENILLNGDLMQRIPGNLNVSFNDINPTDLFLRLQDLAISSGAACMSATVEPSHVLKAMGCNDQHALSAIRFSLGRFTTQEEIDFTIDVMQKNVIKLNEEQRYA